MTNAVSSTGQPGTHTPDNPLRVVVLISGNGSNLQAIIDYLQHQPVSARIVKVISNKPEAYGLTRANHAGIATQVLEAREFNDRESYDNALIDIIDDAQAELVVLAGFMRILSHAFVEHYMGRMINIHPSLLPKYKGLHTHQRVLDAGEHEHGCSVHFVTPELDDGPVVLQASFTINPEETIQMLAQRVHEQEHQIYPMAIEWFANGRLQWKDNRVYLDGEVLTSPRQFQSNAQDSFI